MSKTLKLALEALEYWDVHGGLHQPTEEAITALRLAIDVQNMASESTYKAALAQPAPQRKPVAWSSYEYDGIHHKPVAWMDADGNVSDNNDHKCFPIPLYTITHPTPPAQQCLDCGSNNIGVPATYDSLIGSVKTRQGNT